MMNKMQLNRIAIEKGEEYLLVMHLGETYRDAFLELLDIAEEGIAFYWFARLFEWKFETGIHLYIKELRFGDRIDTNRKGPVWSIAAVVEGINPKVYAKQYERVTGHTLQGIKI